MVSAIDIAGSGLAAAGRRLEESAKNIANANTTKTIRDGQSTDTPYTPQKVEQTSQVTGGVTTTTRNVEPKTVVVPDPNKPGGTQELPNVDLATELVQQKIASYDFKANLRVIDAQRKNDESTLDILS